MRKTIITLLIILLAAFGYSFKDSFRYNRHLSTEWNKGGYLFRDRLRSTGGVLIVDHYFDDFYSEIVRKNGEIEKRVAGGFINFLKDGSYFASLNDEVYLWSHNGNMLWKKKIHLHHDVSINADENAIYFVSGENKKYPGETKFTRKDSVVGLNLRGEEVFYWSIADNLNKIEKIINRKIKRSDGTYRYVYTHFNSVQEIPENILSERSPAFRKGNILVNDNVSKLIFIIDRKTGEIVWHSDPEIGIYAHSVRLRADGTMVFLLNHQLSGDRRNYSSIAFLDPLENRIKKNIFFDPPESFYTETGGSLQILSDDRYLVTDSYKGRAFEITENGRILWEWVYPDSTSGKIHPIYRVLMHPENIFSKGHL